MYAQEPAGVETIDSHVSRLFLFRAGFQSWSWIMGRGMTSAPPAILLHLFLKPDNCGGSRTVIHGDPEER